MHNMSKCSRSVKFEQSESGCERGRARRSRIHTGSQVMSRKSQVDQPGSRICSSRDELRGNWCSELKREYFTPENTVCPPTGTSAPHQMGLWDRMCLVNIPCIYACCQQRSNKVSPAGQKKRVNKSIWVVFSVRDPPFTYPLVPKCLHMHTVATSGADI